MKTKVLVLAALVCVPAMASLVQVGPPTNVAELNAYLALTPNYIDFSLVPNETLISSISDGGRAVSFDAAMEKDTAGPDLADPWFWNVAPGSMLQNTTDTMGVLESSGSSITMHLSSPVTSFGFEISPMSSFDALITATFYADEYQSIGTTFTLDHLTWIILNDPCLNDGICQGGSQIVAATGGPIQRVTLSITPHDLESDTFAVGGFRYGNATVGAVPEPTTSLLIGAGLLLAGVLSRRKLVR